jgi:hypothetical protein
MLSLGLLTFILFFYLFSGVGQIVDINIQYNDSLCTQQNSLISACNNSVLNQQKYDSCLSNPLYLNDSDNGTYMSFGSCNYTDLVYNSSTIKGFYINISKQNILNYSVNSVNLNIDRIYLDDRIIQSYQIPDNCLNLYSDKIELLFSSWNASVNNNYNYYSGVFCNNGTSFELFTDISSGYNTTYNKSYNVTPINDIYVGAWTNISSLMDSNTLTYAEATYTPPINIGDNRIHTAQIYFPMRKGGNLYINWSKSNITTEQNIIDFSVCSIAYIDSNNIQYVDFKILIQDDGYNSTHQFKTTRIYCNSQEHTIFTESYTYLPIFLTRIYDVHVSYPEKQNESYIYDVDYSFNYTQNDLIVYDEYITKEKTDTLTEKAMSILILGGILIGIVLILYKSVIKK